MKVRISTVLSGGRRMGVDTKQAALGERITILDRELGGRLESMFYCSL